MFLWVHDDVVDHVRAVIFLGREGFWVHLRKRIRSPPLAHGGTEEMELLYYNTAPSNQDRRFGLHMRQDGRRIKLR